MLASAVQISYAPAGKLTTPGDAGPWPPTASASPRPRCRDVRDRCSVDAIATTVAAVTQGIPRALVFLDVDGPLIPFGGNPREYATSTGSRADQHRSNDVPTNPLLQRINPENGPRLMALTCELVWATSWMNDANEMIGPLLGLPTMPVVSWPESEADIDHRIHWKTRDLVAFAAGRPFIWIDDEITEADHVWVTAHHQAPVLLWRVDPRIGLTHTDFIELNHWLTAPSAASQQP